MTIYRCISHVIAVFCATWYLSFQTHCSHSHRNLDSGAHTVHSLKTDFSDWPPCFIFFFSILFIQLGFSSYLLKYNFFTPFSVLFLVFMHIIKYVSGILLPTSLMYWSYLYICLLMAHEGEDTPKATFIRCSPKETQRKHTGLLCGVPLLVSL